MWDAPLKVMNGEIIRCSCAAGQGFSDVAQNISVMKLKWTLTHYIYHWKSLPTGWHLSCIMHATEMIQPVQGETSFCGCWPRERKQLLLNLASKDHRCLVSLWCILLSFFSRGKTSLAVNWVRGCFDPISQCLLQCNSQNNQNTGSAASVEAACV